MEPVAEYGTFREALTTKRWSAVVLQPYPAGRVPGITSVVQLYRDNVHLTLDVGRYVAGITTLATLFDQMPTETERPEGTYGAADAISPSLYRVIHDTVRQVLTTRKAETGAGRPVEEASFIPASLPGGRTTSTTSTSRRNSRSALRWQTIPRAGPGRAAA